MTTIDIQQLSEAGVHVGYSRTRRHPTAAPFIYGTKDRLDVFDLEQTTVRLAAATEYVANLAQSGRTLLFVGGKNEASAIVKDMAERANMPFVAGRWIGGTLTNFKNIRKRIERMEKLTAERERGELEKYTKKERLLIDREITELNGRFGGLSKLTDLPAALFVVDTRHDSIAVNEANQLGIPVIALAGNDCDFNKIQLPIPGNDANIKSITLIAKAIADAYSNGKRAPVASAAASHRAK